jgi:hypothetical protein
MADATTLTRGQESALGGAGRSHSGLIEAQHRLQRALGQAQPGREREWAGLVLREMQAARQLLAAHREEVQGADGLYDQLRFEAPWLLPRLQQMVAQMARLEAEAADLETEARRVSEGDLSGLLNIRHDAERMLALLRDLLAKESDLIYERFNQPPALD